MDALSEKAFLSFFIFASPLKWAQLVKKKSRTHSGMTRDTNRMSEQQLSEDNKACLAVIILGTNIWTRAF